MLDSSSASQQPVEGASAAPAWRAEVYLTDREIETIWLLSDGLLYKEIADRMGVSLATAKFHVANVLKKLKARTATHAVSIAFRKGIVS